MSQRSAEHSVHMSTEGELISARRNRLTLDLAPLAKLAGVSRATLTSIEDGRNFHRSSLRKIHAALDALEFKAYGVNVPPLSPQAEPVVEFEVIDPDGAHIIIRGPVSNLAEIEASVERLARRGSLHVADTTE